MSGQQHPGRHYELIIVGGGMVGNALACDLADSGFNIALLEQHATPMDWPAEGFDPRVSAITRASQQLFQRLGVWQTMCADRVSPYREMRVWDAGGAGSIHFDAADIGEPDLGHIIENRVITRALAARARQHDTISIHCPVRSRRLDLRPEAGVQLQLDDGTLLSADLIVGADGGNSWVRQQAGIDTVTHDYQQQAVVATVKTEHDHGETAWQRFLATGPLAFLPLTDGYSSIVWSTGNEQATRLLALDDEGFCQALAEAFEFKLGKVLQTSPRAAFPLVARHAREYVKPGLVLVGDAAHTIHPLAGQGVNLGFADVVALAETLNQARALDQPIGSYKVLRRYERARRGENQLTLQAMSAFKTLFSNDSPWLGSLRNLGLDLADHIPAAKRFFMRQGMGI